MTSVGDLLIAFGIVIGCISLICWLLRVESALEAGEDTTHWESR